MNIVKSLVKEVKILKYLLANENDEFVNKFIT